MINKVNLYGVDEIIKLGKVFEAEGWELGSIFIEDKDGIKTKNKTLDFYGSDITPIEGETKVYVSIDNDEKFHRAWFKKVSWDAKKFSSWKMYQEEICYKN